MIGLELLTIIVRGDIGEEYHEYLTKHHQGLILSLLCRGTANQRLLDYVGLEDDEKKMFLLVAKRDETRKLTDALSAGMGLSLPGYGVAFTVSMSCLGGHGSMSMLSGNYEIEVKDAMEGTNLFELIIAIANRGYSETVMDAARSVGAMGGTVLSAKGTNPTMKESFFGLSIADEKDIIFILTAAIQKKKIMQCIMDQAGLQSPAHTVLFSLPVNDVAGLKSVRIAAGIED